MSSRARQARAGGDETATDSGRPLNELATGQIGFAQIVNKISWVLLGCHLMSFLRRAQLRVETNLDRLLVNQESNAFVISLHGKGGVDESIDSHLTG